MTNLTDVWSPLLENEEREKGQVFTEPAPRLIQSISCTFRVLSVVHSIFRSLPAADTEKVHGLLIGLIRLLWRLK